MQANIIGGTLNIGDEFCYIHLLDNSIEEVTVEAIYKSPRNGNVFITHLTDEGSFRTVSAKRAFKNKKIALMEMKLSRSQYGK
jgi:hypothetical protein